MGNSSLFRKKLEEAGANEAAISCFLRGFELLEKGTDFSLPESGIDPAADIPMMDDVLVGDTALHAKYIGESVVIKLNGGLGTGMGLKTAKSLLEVKKEQTFLDLMAQQISHLRKSTGQQVKFLLMNSFSTSEATNAYLQKYPAYADSKEVEMMQNFSPKVLRDSLEPASWPANDQLEWCPPGHGDIYTALYGSGWLDTLLDQGIKYAFISNSDNLGAFLNPALLAYFAESKLPFLMEVTRRTAADSKGGHLAVRKSDGQLLLREVAQCQDADLDEFQNISKHQFFNTNNLWLRLDVLKEVMEEEGGYLPLPVITNKKTIDPRDSESPAVYQLEIAMGAAIECFKGAGAVCVPRRRFTPVKKTSDLMSLRSDAYEIHASGRVMLIPERNNIPPNVKLSNNFKFVDQLEELGIPSLKDAKSLTVEGNIRFERGVVIKGDVTILNSANQVLVVPARVYENETVTPETVLRDNTSKVLA